MVNPLKKSKMRSSGEAREDQGERGQAGTELQPLSPGDDTDIIRSFSVTNVGHWPENTD